VGKKDAFFGRRGWRDNKINNLIQSGVGKEKGSSRKLNPTG